MKYYSIIKFIIYFLHTNAKKNLFSNYECMICVRLMKQNIFHKGWTILHALRKIYHLRTYMGILWQLHCKYDHVFYLNPLRIISESEKCTILHMSAEIDV